MIEVIFEQSAFPRSLTSLKWSASKFKYSFNDNTADFCFTESPASSNGSPESDADVKEVLMGGITLLWFDDFLDHFKEGFEVSEFSMD